MDTVLNKQQHQQLSAWLAETGELYVDLFLPHSGSGSTGFLLRSVQELEELISQQTWQILNFTVFRRLQFPLRGIADEALLKSALLSVPDDFYQVILVTDEGYYPSGCKYVGSGDSHQDLIQEFTSFKGQLVGIGQNPFDFDTKWIEESPSEAMIITLELIGNQYQRIED